MQQEKNKTKASPATAREVYHSQRTRPQLTGRSLQRDLAVQAGGPRARARCQAAQDSPRQGAAAPPHLCNQPHLSLQDGAS